MVSKTNQSDAWKGKTIIFYNGVSWSDITSNIGFEYAQRIAVDTNNNPWIVDAFGKVFSFNGVGWNKEHFNNASTPVSVNAIDIGIGKLGNVYIIDPYGTPYLLGYNEKERIHMTSATQTSTYQSGTTNEHKHLASNPLKNLLVSEYSSDLSNEVESCMVT